MPDTSRIAALSLSFTMACALAVTPQAGGSTTGTTGANRSGNTTANGSTTANGNGGTSNGAAHYSGGGLLCAGLLESGILGDVFTVTPVSAAHREDLGSAIQFTPIWSDSHQATVGDTSPVEPPKSKPAVAIIKLPISFSEADRQKFAAAGWKPRKTGALGISYCLDRAGPTAAAASPVTQGMICVTAAP
jgi:hypothetical protein